MNRADKVVEKIIEEHKSKGKVAILDSLITQLNPENNSTWKFPPEYIKALKKAGIIPY